MRLSGQIQKNLLTCMFLLWLIFFTSLIFSWRALTSVALAALILSGLVFNKIETRRLFNKKFIDLFSVFCIAFYLLQFISLLFVHNTTQQWNEIRIKSTLVFLPLAVNCCNYIN